MPTNTTSGYSGNDTTDSTPATPTITVSPSYGNFFSNFLAGIGLGNISNQQRIVDEQALADIVHYEGSNTYNNPFNITYDTSKPATKGVASYNSVGVQEYASLQQGLDATIAFFQPGTTSAVWNNFLSSLSSGSHDQIVAAVDSAYQSWGSHGPSNYGTQTENQVITGNAGTGKINQLPNVPSNWDVFTGAVDKTAGQVASTITSPLDFLKSIYSDISSKDWWIRVGFIILGLLLLVIAVDKITSGGLTSSPAGPAVKVIEEKDPIVSKATEAGEAA